MIAAIIQYRKIILCGIVLVAIIGGHFYGYSKGRKVEKNRCNAEKYEAIQNNLGIKELQDNVLRLDNIALINSLYGGSF